VETVEIRKYQGQDLSSIRDSRENSIKGPQHIDIARYRLKVNGLIEKDLSFTYKEITSIPGSRQKVITLDCVEGWSVTHLWEGLPIKILLARTTLKPQARAVIFHASDGYTSALPLKYLIDKDIMLAWKMNGVTLSPERGFPLHLVAESKWGYKWTRWVTEMEITDDATYRGYWEKRGYSNDGDLDKEFFDG
jgi:DMSO/TMAO reductase YedYZ molybdopterin-dependent catalytic subunit